MEVGVGVLVGAGGGCGGVQGGYRVGTGPPLHLFDLWVWEMSSLNPPLHHIGTLLVVLLALSDARPEEPGPRVTTSTSGPLHAPRFMMDLYQQQVRNSSILQGAIVRSFPGTALHFTWCEGFKSGASKEENRFNFNFIIITIITFDLNNILCFHYYNQQYYFFIVLFSYIFKLCISIFKIINSILYYFIILFI